MTTSDRKDHPKVSIIVPFLNPPAQFFREAVESVLAQTFTDWELLLVNDGSGPAATELAREYSRRFPAKVRLLGHDSGPNRGASATRNVGLAHALGEVLAFLDADDVWLPTKLAEHVRVIEAHPTVAMVYGRSRYWRSWTNSGADGAHDFVPVAGVETGVIHAPPSLVSRFITGRAAVPAPSSWLVRAQAAHGVGGFDESFVGAYRARYEDQVFLAKVALEHELIACETVLEYYRLHPDSVTGTPDRRVEETGRREFLHWLESYVQARGVRHAGLRRAIRIEQWALDHPRGARVYRSLRRLASSKARRMAESPS